MRLTILVLALVLTASGAFAQSGATGNTQPSAATGATGSTTVQAPAVVPPAVPPVTPPAPTPAQPGAPGAVAPCPACADSVDAYWIAFYVVTGLLLVVFAAIAIALKNSDWSLADALAEKSTDLKKVTTVKQTASQEGTLDKPIDQIGESTTVEQPAMVGSASRLFAMLGTLVLAAVMLGIGYAMIWSLFTRGNIPALEGIGPYLMGGAALFAPYAFNQLKEAFKPAPKQ